MIRKTLYYKKEAGPGAYHTEGRTIQGSDVDIIHGAVQEGAANAFPGPITQPDVPRIVTATFAAGWQGGDITITGVDADGVAATDVIADSAGATVAGTQVFSRIDSISKELVAGTTDAVTIGVNNTVSYYTVPWKSDDGQGLHVRSTGTLTGAFTLWKSDLMKPRLGTDVDWVEDADFVPTDPAAGTTSFRDDTAVDKAYWKRLKYAHTSGAGAVFADMTAPSRL